MKKQYGLLLTLVVILLASCNKHDKIVDDDSLIFSYHRHGGWSGLDEKLKINANMTDYSISYIAYPPTGNPKSYQTTIKTSAEQWNYLKATFDLETFKKIQDGYCQACVDGVDEEFSVTKDSITYSFYNGGGDEHYKQMQEFFDTII
ncbi:MAG: hypothetical protein FWD66_10795, partial [Paludibacter sp.]|nr:hypothetical protein [Paludibacter sp.]